MGVNEDCGKRGETGSFVHLDRPRCSSSIPPFPLVSDHDISHIKLRFAPSSIDSWEFGYACILRRFGARHWLCIAHGSFRIYVQLEACSTCKRLSLNQKFMSWTNDLGSESVRIETIRMVHDPHYCSLGIHRRLPHSELYPLFHYHVPIQSVFPGSNSNAFYIVPNSHKTDSQTINCISHTSNPPEPVPERASDRFHHRSNDLQQNTRTPSPVHQQRT